MFTCCEKKCAIKKSSDDELVTLNDKRLELLGIIQNEVSNGIGDALRKTMAELSKEIPCCWGASFKFLSHFC